jgi:protein associated with RNAse G/E
MNIVSLHGDGSPHRHWPDVRCTDEPWVFYVPPGSPVIEASGRRWSDVDPVFLMFWPNRFYQVCLLMRPDRTDYYCNVIAPPRYFSDTECVEFYDLDLDVLCMDGEVRVLDEDEFERRRSAYPAAWIVKALEAKDWLLRAATTRTGPFAPATAQRWRDWLGR